MAYMRGDYYLWDDVSGLHIWAADGYDGWDEAGWHLDCDNDGNESVTASHLKDGENTASGVSIHQDIMDEYVMMRLAELILEGKVEETIDRVMAPGGGSGNGGARVLSQNAEKLKAALRQIQLDRPPPIR